MRQISDTTEPGDPIGQFPAVAHDEFESIEAAVMETVRGRWFLREFARRRWMEETSRIIAAIERLESRTHEVAAAEARARAESERASNILRAIGEMLGEWRQPAPAAAADLETRLAALARLDGLAADEKLSLFG